MEIYFLNSDLEDIWVLDTFDSLIWTDRYWSCGDLDLTCAPTIEILTILAGTSYFRIKESPHIMVLETAAIEYDQEDGDLLVIQGRSLESILDRRIVWDGTALSGNLQTQIISRLLDESIINPTDTDRDISNFITSTSTDPLVTALTVDTQFVGEYIYTAIANLCEANGIGFRVFPLYSTNQFEFKLYAGVDRSYDQSTNPSVAFTADLDNLISSNYVESSKFEKTVVLVAGEEGVGNTRTTVEVAAPGGSKTGLARKEMYFEANINRNSPDGELTEAEYIDQLTGKGVEELAKNIYVQDFDGEVDTTMYNYGDEFSMGDILQIADKYGHQTKSRVIEMIYSQNAEGIKAYPTFQTV
jgi:hypothetical protein